MPKRGWSLFATPAQLLANTGLLAARRVGLMRAAVELQGEWKAILNQPGSGKVYEVGTSFITTRGRVVPVKGTSKNPGRSSAHQASAPGEPPAPDRGILRNSIEIDVKPDRIRVGTGLRQGLALEYGVNVSGTKTGPHPGENYRLQPRPHVRPAGEAAKSPMTQGMKLEFQRKVRGPELSDG